MQTSLLAGALTSPRLMSSHRYVRHTNISPFWTSFLTASSPHPDPHIPSPNGRSQDTGELEKRVSPESQPDKDSFSKDIEQGTHLAESLLLVIQMSLIMSAPPTSQGYCESQMRLKENTLKLHRIGKCCF